MELTGAQAEWAKISSADRHRSDFSDGLLAAHDQEGFARFDAAEEGKRILLDFLHADRGH